MITRDEALNDGMAPATIARRVRSGVWERLHQGVYLVERPRDASAAWRSALAGQLARTDGLGVISHRSAAALHRLDGFIEGVTELSVPLSCAHVGPFHRSGSLETIDVVIIDGMRVTSVARTIQDLAVRSSAEDLERTIESALRIDPARPDEWNRLLLAELRDRAALPARLAGSRRLRLVLLRRTDDDRPTGSYPETVLLQACRSAGLVLLRQPEVRLLNARGAVVVRFWPDFCLPGVGLLIEVDGASAHGSASALDRDLVRQNRLGEAFDIVRFSASRVLRDPARVAMEIDARRTSSTRRFDGRAIWTGAGFDVAPR